MLIKEVENFWIQGNTARISTFFFFVCLKDTSHLKMSVQAEFKNKHRNKNKKLSLKENSLRKYLSTVMQWPWKLMTRAGNIPTP